MMKALILILSIFSLSNGAGSFAQSTRGGGGIILDENLKIRQEDLIRKSNCRETRKSFRTLIPNQKTWNRFISKITEAHWYLGDYLRREANHLEVCLTGRLKDLSIADLENWVVYSEAEQTPTPRKREQLAIRLGDYIFLNEDVYSIMQSVDQVTALIHEIVHGIIPDRIEGVGSRSTFVSNVSRQLYAIANPSGTEPISSDDLNVLIRRNGMNLVETSQLSRFEKYRISLNRASSFGVNPADFYQALGALDLENADDWITSIDQYRIRQSSDQILVRSREILKHNHENLPGKHIATATQELQQELSRGILASVRTFTVNGLQSLIKEASELMPRPHTALLRLLSSQTSTVPNFASTQNSGGLEAEAAKIIERQFSDFDLTQLLNAGLNPNNLSVRGMSLLTYAASVENWNAFYLFLESPEFLSDQTLNEALSVVLEMANNGKTDPLQTILNLDRVRLSPKVLWNLYEKDLRTSFSILLPQIDAQQINTAIDLGDLKSLALRFASIKPASPNQIEMQNQFFGKRLDINVGQLDREGQDLFQLAVRSGNKVALSNLFGREDVNWSPRSTLPQDAYFETKAIIGAIIETAAEGRGNGAILLNHFKSIIQNDLHLSSIDLQMFAYRCKDQALLSAFETVLTERINREK